MYNDFRNHKYGTHNLATPIYIVQKISKFYKEIHKRLETTQIYTKASTQKLKEIESPLDDL